VRVVAGVAVAGLVLFSLVPSAGEWLVQPVHVRACGLLVVLGGGAQERLATGLDLAGDGACGGRLLLTAPPAAAEALRSMAARGELGRPDPDIETSHNTFEDAIVALDGARRAGARSVLVVTSPYHTRRASWVFSRVFGHSGPGIGVYPSESFYVDYRRWWASRDGRGVVLGEYGKLLSLGLLSESLLARVGLDAWPG